MQMQIDTRRGAAPVPVQGGSLANWGPRDGDGRTLSARAQSSSGTAGARRAGFGGELRYELFGAAARAKAEAAAIAAGALSSGAGGGRNLDEAKIEAAYIRFHQTLNGRLGKAESIHKRLATVVETDALVDRQLWIDSIPKMRRWVGDKTLHKLRAESMSIVTEPYEDSIEISKQSVLNDKLGMWMPKIKSLGDAYDWALDELFIGMLVAGIQGTALGTTYDGQNLIDTDHTALGGGGVAQSNKVTGALTSTTYNTAWSRYLGFVDENSVPMNVAGRRMTLIVGPNNREVARDIIAQETQANGEQNMDAGTADLIVTPWLIGRTINVKGVNITITGNEWLLLPSDSTAVLIHVKRPPEFLSVEEGEHAFRTGKYLYGIEAEFGAGYGLWQEVVGGPGS